MPPPPQRASVLLLLRCCCSSSLLFLLLLLLLLLLLPAHIDAWAITGTARGARGAPARPSPLPLAATTPSHNDNNGGGACQSDRRQAALVQGSALFLSAAATLLPPVPKAAAAVAKLEPLVPPPLVTYDDPEGVFQLRIPEGWFTKRKNPKGPNGEGILFISGDFNKAITLSVERLHVKPLMKRAGINVTDVPDAGYANWDAYASKDGMAALLASHKEAMVGGPTKNVYAVLDDSIQSDKGVLTFDFVTEVRVERPDLLMEEMGVSRLERRTTARALLLGDGDALICWSAALSTDWGRGYDKLLTDIVSSLAPGAGGGGKKEKA